MASGQRAVSISAASKAVTRPLSPPQHCTEISCRCRPSLGGVLLRVVTGEHFALSGEPVLLFLPRHASPLLS